MKKNVLFLCTGNSCRSQMAEAILNEWKNADYRAYSAGSAPNKSNYKETNGVHPIAIETLKANGLSTDGLASKSWDSFIKEQDMFDFVITLCDEANDELKSDTCPFWPGNSIRGHWGLFDPDKVEGDEKFIKSKFQEAFDIIKKRIKAFLELKLDTMDEREMTNKINDIGRLK